MSESKELAIVPRNFGEVQSMAEVLSKSSLLPEALRGKAADVAFSIMTGAELGLGPLASIRGIHVIQGKPVLSADTMVACVLGSGLCEYFTCIEDTETSQTYETKRKGSPHAQRSTFTMVDAKRAGVHLKDNWRMWPRSMMKARAKSALARDAYPDVLAGVYDPDELQVAATPLPRTAPTEVIEDAEIVSDMPDLSAIDKAETEEELIALTPWIKGLKNGALQAARERYGARREFIRKRAAAAVVAEPAVEPAAEAVA